MNLNKKHETVLLNEIVVEIINNIDKVLKYEANEKIKICNSLIDELTGIDDKKIKEKILFIVYKLSEEKEVIENIKLDVLMKLIYTYIKEYRFFNEKYYDEKSLIYLLYILAYSGQKKCNDIINLFVYDKDEVIRREALNAGREFALRYKKEKIDIISETKKVLDNRDRNDLYLFDITLGYYIFSDDELKKICDVLENYLKIEKNQERIEGILYLLNFLSLEKEATKFINIDFLISKASDYNLQGLAYVLEIIGDTLDSRYLPFLEKYSNSDKDILKEAANEAIRTIEDEGI